MATVTAPAGDGSIPFDELERELGSSLETTDAHEPDTERITLIVADADPLARRVMRDSLQSSEYFVVAAEAKTGVEAVELAVHYKPHVLLTEVGLPCIDGIEACRRVTEKSPEVRVVMFDVNQDRDVEMQAIRAGAAGFLNKDASLESITRALHAVARGEAAVSRHLTMRLMEIVRRTSVNGIGLRPVKSELTSREWEVLDLLCSGAATREIADSLYLSEDTVYSHCKSIMRKLGVHSRAEAVDAAERLRLPAAA